MTVDKNVDLFYNDFSAKTCIQSDRCLRFDIEPTDYRGSLGIALQYGNIKIILLFYIHAREYKYLCDTFTGKGK